MIADAIPEEADVADRPDGARRPVEERGARESFGLELAPQALRRNASGSSSDSASGDEFTTSAWPHR